MKKNLAAVIAILVVMFGFPGATVAFASHDAGMATTFILLFGLNPTESMFVGIFAGRKPKQRWFLPFVNAAAFLLGVWTVFDWGNPDFYGYAIAYLSVALISMLATIVVIRNIWKELNRQ